MKLKISAGVIFLFFLMAVYAPFLASSKPLFVEYNGNWYFPLFRYLFYPGFFTKPLDLFFNLLVFILPFFLLCRTLKGFFLLSLLQFALFLIILFFPMGDPSGDLTLNRKRQEAIQKGPLTPEQERSFLTPYAILNELVQYRVLKQQHKKIAREVGTSAIPTLFEEKSPWIASESEKLRFLVMPLIRPFHWQDDAGGSQWLNQRVSWLELTRGNRKDLTAALIFGARISFTVGFAAIAIALAIGIPLGAIAGYYGGKVDILLSRMLEIWESMPVFFMLLLVVGIIQSKSIFIVIFVIGIFGWTTFSRFIRGEFFKQRSLPYVEACFASGFSDPYIMFRHILPNALPPLLTLLPFAIMGAITSEAGLSFLGLGEEGSCSWGVLMDDGRQSFPGESYLLWPPAFLLTTLLVAIALVGDSLRDLLDPKLHELEG